MSALKDAHLHRFGDHVAISLPGRGETKYLTAKEARALAKRLNEAARDIGARKFTDSIFGSPVVKLTNEGNRS